MTVKAIERITDYTYLETEGDPTKATTIGILGLKDDCWNKWIVLSKCNNCSSKYGQVITCVRTTEGKPVYVCSPRAGERRLCLG